MNSGKQADMKITIAGCGIVGTALAERFAINKHNVTIIDVDAEHLDYVQNIIDVMCINGDATAPDILDEAGMKDTDLFIAVTSSDEHNLLACLVARKLGAGNTIARVRTTQNTKTANLLRDEMGLSMVINPEMDTSREIFNSLKYKPVGRVEPIAKGSAEIITCEIKEGAPICGVAIRDLNNVTGTRILICGLKRDENVFIPTADTVIQAGDILSFAATTRNTLTFFKKIKYETEPIKNLVIIGGSKLGVFLARRVLEAGVPVTMIDNDEDRCRQLLSLIPEADIICGDGTDANLLEEEGVLSSSVVVAATEDDSTNTMIALYLSKVAPNTKSVIKIKKSDFEDMLYSLNIGAIYNPKYIAVDHIENYVNAMQNSLVKDEVESMCRVIDNKVTILEFNISEGMPNLNTPLKDVGLKKNLLIPLIYRKGRPFIPGANDLIQVGDIVIVATMDPEINRFAEIFA